MTGRRLLTITAVLFGWLAQQTITATAQDDTALVANEPVATQPSDAAAVGANLKLQAFNLQHTLALSAFETIKQLYPETVTSMDQRANLLIVRGTPSQIEEVSRLIEVLDVPPATGPFTDITQQLTAARFGQETALLPPQAGIPRGRSMLQRSERSTQSVDDNQVLRDTLASIIELGQQAGGTGEPAPIPQELKAAVRTQVEATFQARQNLQRSELQILNLQLERIKQSIAARKRVKEQIIDDRVDQLLTAATGLFGPPLAQTGGENPALTPTATPVSNPRVLSMHWNEAEKVLTAVGLTVKLRRGKVAAKAEDIFKVYDQLPAAGTTMKSGESVILTLFLGPDTRNISDTIPQPMIDLSGPTSLRELRTTIEQLLVELQSHQTAAERNPKRPDIEAVQARLRLTHRRLDVYRAELAAQKSLAKLEVDDAKSEVDHSVRTLDNAQTRFKSGVAKEPEVLDAQRAVEKASFRLKRAETLLGLFHQSDEPEKSTPFKPQPPKTPTPVASPRSL